LANNLPQGDRGGKLEKKAHTRASDEAPLRDTEQDPRPCLRIKMQHEGVKDSRKRTSDLSEDMNVLSAPEKRQQEKQRAR
jgi:hypothetical protein